MAHSPALPLLAELAPLLATDRLGRAARGRLVTGSTNADAVAWAREGAPDGALVVAERQTAGRGRLGRAWQAAAGRNLTFSVVLRPQGTARLGLVPLAAGLAVAEALEGVVAPCPVAIKWPNDVLLDGLKGCGILTESAFDPSGRPAHVVVGVGLNVNQDAFPPALADRATSAALAAGRPLARAPLLADVLLRLEHHTDALATSAGAERLRAAYEARLHGLGHPLHLRLTTTDGGVRGTLAGIAPDGALRLATPDGPRTFHAGEVTTQGAR